MTNEEFQKLVLEKLNTLETKLGNLEGRTKENTDLIHALINRTDIIDAKLDGLTVSTASKEALDQIDAKLDVLNARLFKSETDIQLLKKAE